MAHFPHNGAFAGKVAVVTGAASGIGRALAVQLAQAGAQLAISDVNQAGLAETLALAQAQSPRQGGAQMRAYVLDVAKREQVLAHAAEVQRDFGTAHFVFNNAGVSLVGTVAHATLDEMAWQLDINLWGVIHGTKAFLPMLLAQRAGHIINISSVFGFVAIPGQAAYNISKFGVRALTECLWQELRGTGVQATCVHPGGIRTAIGHKARMSVNADATEHELIAHTDQLLTTPPEHMARAILQGVARGKKRIVYGRGAWLLYGLQRLFPVSYGRILQALKPRR